MGAEAAKAVPFQHKVYWQLILENYFNEGLSAEKNYAMRPDPVIGRRPEFGHMHRHFDSSSCSNRKSTNRKGQLKNGWNPGKNSSHTMSLSFSHGKDSLYSASRHTSETTFRQMFWTARIDLYTLFSAMQLNLVA